MELNYSILVRCYESLFFKTSQAVAVLTGCHWELGSEQVDNDEFRLATGLSKEVHQQVVTSMRGSDLARGKVLREHFTKLGIALKVGM